MARIIDPQNLNAQGDLVTAIETKHIADGAASPLTVFLTEQGIDLADDLLAIAAAKVLNNEQGALAKKAESLREDRDKSFDLIFGTYKKMVQFLKALYKPNTLKLGDWGVTVNYEQKIVYPVAFAERVNAMLTFANKSNSFTPGTNPLQPFFTLNNINLTGLPAELQVLLNQNEEFTETERLAEEKTEARNDLMAPVINHYKGIGGYLMKLYSATPKKVGLWGFVVDESPRAPKYRTSTVKLGQQITIQGATIGGTLFNIGTVTVNVYKGKTATGESISVTPNQSIGIEKGFSVITVVNPSATTSAKFKVLCSE